jgi:5'-nucleotidase (lipoprotein e(P4) family)
VWRRLLLAALALVSAGCGARGTAPPPRPQVAPQAAEADQAVAPSKAVRWVRDSAEHRALFLQVYRSAIAYIETQAATREDGTWAVVVDADETLLDNSVYQVEREGLGLGFTAESWKTWTERREAVPLPGARSFLERVRGLGGRIAVVTNRREGECPDTRAVFDAQGLHYDLMLCRPDNGPSDKTSRFQAVRGGTTSSGLPPLEVVAFLGDSIRDFPDAGSGEPMSEGFPGPFFIVPNPMYGGWE